MKAFPVIMAGGKGERFWPKSRQNLPKQFLSLIEEDTMLQLTAKRMLSIAPVEDIYVLTGADYKELVLEQLPMLPERNVIIEPTGRNTAPCIGLAAALLGKIYPEDGIMVIVPSDHVILEPLHYRQTMRAAIAVCERQNGVLATIGIKPMGPETAYGYIEQGAKVAEVNNQPIYSVQRFVEKPVLAKAKEYFASGDYLWNSGSFIGKVSTIYDNINVHMPELYSLLEDIKASYGMENYELELNAKFPQAPAVSFDYGVMEKAAQVMVIPGDFGWDDVGSWTSLERLVDQNRGESVNKDGILSLDSTGCIIQKDNKGKLIALLDVHDLIVVDTEDVTLICAKDKAQEVKRLLESLKQQEMVQYL